MEHTQDNNVSLNNPLSRLAYVVAKISLRFNLMYLQFMELYKYHLLMLAIKQNPDYSQVQLSARTGLDRRYVSKMLSKQQLQKHQSKVDLVLQQIRHVCVSNNTDLIAKHGGAQSFEGICQQLAAGSLTPKAIAQELLRKGELKDMGRRFKVMFFSDQQQHTAFINDYMLKMICSDMRAVCLKNGNQFIQKGNKKDSFEQIIQRNIFNDLSLLQVKQTLIDLKCIEEQADCYKVLDDGYTPTGSYSQLVLMCRELDRLCDTIIFNISRKRHHGKLHKVIYSNQIHPKHFTELNQQIGDFFIRVKYQLFEMLGAFEEQTPRRSYPAYGVAMHLFEDQIIDEDI